MNAFPENESNEAELPANRALAEGLDERLFDLLVDGELSTAERRELFARLDQRPESWRRLALAFVEAQSWRSDLAALAAPAVVVEVAPTAQPCEASRPAESHQVAPRGPRLPRWAQTMLTLAASMLCAFFLGLEARKQWPAAPSGDPPPANLAKDGPAMPEVARNPDDTGSMPQARLVSGNVGSLTLDEPSRGSIELPVFQGAEYEQWVRDQPSAISGHLRRALERRGHQVDVQRQFVPLQLEDGRRVIVPVEQVEVRPARREFQ
jgi:hypothetical protein